MGFLTGFKAYSRRKFLITGGLVLGGISVAKQFWPLKPSPGKTAKFLTHDGKLVEVDLKGIQGRSKPVSDEELAKWIWKDQEFKKEV